MSSAPDETAAVSRVRTRGPLAALDAADRERLFERSTSRDEVVRATTARILERVERDGDAALMALARELDGVVLDTLEVPAEECRRALETLDPALRAALERAAANLTTAQRASLPRGSEIETEPGIVVGRRADPLARVGVYAPGGRADYPSSVLMGAIPARVAGVKEIVLCSPPGPDGRPSSVVLAAAALAGVDRVFAIGGAGAIAALAFGTASVPRVDAIVGPGNAYVAEAKLQVAGRVTIDAPAGPSELLVIADAGAAPERIALELVAQAEHDPRACVAVVAIGSGVARAIESALAEAASRAERRAIVETSLAERGAVLTADTLEEALAFACEYAPEHLLLAVADPDAALARVRNAGTVFLGAGSSVVFGDYATGANHILPTGGLARCWSGLGAEHFMRWTTWQRVRPDAAAALAADVALLATRERLPGHAAAARAAGADGGLAPRVVPELDLSDNTNRFGVPPAAVRELARLDEGAVTRYPSPHSDDLAAALAETCGVPPGFVLPGCGSDDVLDAAFRALASPGERVAWSEPTFSMIPLLARSNRLAAAPVAFAANFDLDVAALLATGARLIYVCSPNNPTGATASTAAIERLLAGAPGVVVLDEAYGDFARQDWARRVPDFPHLIVVRTLSKAFGLAGLRVGYAVAAPRWIAALAAARGPYKVTAAAERCAAAVVREDVEWVRARAAEAVAMRERFTAALRERRWAPLDSAANFVLLPVRSAAATAASLRCAGVVVRPFEALPGVGDAVRITMAPWPALERVLAALAEAPR